MKQGEFRNWILFENNDFIVINKPPYISTLSDRNDKVNIISLAKEYWPDAQVCHRLDKETSGALAIAKNPEAYRHLSMQFENREVVKVYHAVVAGLHQFEEELVDRPILPLGHGVVKLDKAKGKPAETIFNTLTTFRKHTLVECLPVTGRMHQIRIHLTSLGTPIICDEQYGGEPLYISSLKKKFNLKKDTEELPLIKRVALHAYELHFYGLGNEKISTIAPYPKDFDVLIKQLEKNA
ncbi:MAG TPA: RNA pseudouridine synthase [Cytophagales bacterium]|nr:RNA pseudouridine synthase [Cytophagales bacterium]